MELPQAHGYRHKKVVANYEMPLLERFQIGMSCHIVESFVQIKPTTMFRQVVYLLLLTCPLLTSAQETDSISSSAIPQWLLDDWAERAQGTGIWITDNADYQSEAEPFDAYGLVWEYGLGQQYLKGRLYCMNDGKEVLTVWEMLEYWDPATQTAKVMQLGADGTVGSGDIAPIEEGKFAGVMSFSSPSGGSFTVGHHTWTIDKIHHTQSFTVDGEEWSTVRYYAWTLQ